MTVVIFTLPGLVSTSLIAGINGNVLPPASMGDVYRAASERPEAIVLINGVLESGPAVRHKEVLWAISQGVRVYGCSGIGALRATELSAYGMIGAGWIYESYRDGHLVGDDEVTAQYRLSSDEFVRISEPLANMRRTFAKAVGQYASGEGRGRL
jgi:hypothetical protein